MADCKELNDWSLAKAGDVRSVCARTYSTEGRTWEPHNRHKVSKALDQVDEDIDPKRHIFQEVAVARTRSRTANLADGQPALVERQQREHDACDGDGEHAKGVRRSVFGNYRREDEGEDEPADGGAGEDDATSGSTQSYEPFGHEEDRRCVDERF